MMGATAVEDEEEDEFHESFDRILSSSCSSTSASDDDAAADARQHRGRRHGGASAGVQLLRGVSARFQTMYDVWTSPPGSVEERRHRLLKKLGLLGDLTLARGEMSEDPEQPTPPDSNNERTGPNSAEFVVRDARSDAVMPLSNSELSDDRYCTIKNLDNGEEFVVKELREDGMWEKLREVGTGRQLTMEEFQVSVIGHSPIVQELMRRQGEEISGSRDAVSIDADGDGFGVRSKRRVGWLRSIRNMAGGVTKRMERRSSDEKDTSSEKGGRRSSSATDDSQDVHFYQGNERVRVRQYGKQWKELTGLYMNQEIQAHYGSIWSIRFRPDGRLLASAGEDCVIHVWQVVESERKRDLMMEKGMGGDENGNGSTSTSLSVGANASPEPAAAPSSLERDNSEKRRATRASTSRKSFSLDHVVFSDFVLALSERPVCSFRGHQKDVLDLSWSKSEQLLSSSMDKTVRLWDMSGSSCLRVFSHSDYVTCIQFNPIDDKYFISGSLDSKVRLWSIEDHQVVDWIDLHEMVTAACYTADGQGALIGSHKGTCNFYKLSGNRFQQRTEINLQNKKKRSHPKKITGFQFVPGSLSEVLITSADSRIRVVDNTDLVHKFKGFRNTSSQISASMTVDGNHIICASEDSHVYVWRYDPDPQTNRSKGVVSVTQSNEHFHCRDVSVAAAWPGTSTQRMPRCSSKNCNEENTFSCSCPNTVNEPASRHPKSPLPAYKCNGHPHIRIPPSANGYPYSDHISNTWPGDKPPPSSPSTNKQSPQNSGESNTAEIHKRSAWGMVIVTASRGGEIRVFQNFGYPVRV